MMIKLIDLIITLVTTIASIVGFVMIMAGALEIRNIDFDFWFILAVISLCLALIWVEISNRFINWE